ncbi:hypothetical protein SLEP1_g22801 [Rubroshorea leprosula]|uniref:DUF4219 domain-containing protein n=1 Tax=Rubroshorea leprosula TaxID=152421 RepID=A0AAV5JJK2_9ROSI|nr:hypothetical protein SLEP1_g22801 [Rubroshorea leprosula]
MAQFQATTPPEGVSTTKPPFYGGSNYNYWKNGMKVFMFANEPKAWLVTMNGPYMPMKVVGEIEVPKEEIEWNDENLDRTKINNKASNMLQSVVNPTKFKRTFGCDTTKEIGTCWIQHMKGQIKFNNIVTNLKALGKVYPTKESVRKIFKSLPKSCEAKKIAIEEAKNINTLKLDELIGSLMTYEIDTQNDVEVEVVEKKKNAAFKVNKQKEENEDDASDGEDDASDGEDITTLVLVKTSPPWCW